MKEASHKQSRILWFHLYDRPWKSKPSTTESRFVVAWGWGCALGTAHGQEAVWDGGNVLTLEFGDDHTVPCFQKIVELDTYRESFLWDVTYTLIKLLKKLIWAITSNVRVRPTANGLNKASCLYREL